MPNSGKPQGETIELILKALKFGQCELRPLGILRHGNSHPTNRETRALRRGAGPAATGPARLAHRFATRRAVPMFNHTRSVVDAKYRFTVSRPWRAGSHGRLRIPAAWPRDARRR